jgi:hypothetical protein
VGQKPAANNLPARRPFVSFGGLGFGALRRAPHPHSPRPGWPRATSQAGTVRCKFLSRQLFVGAPGPPAVGRKEIVMIIKNDAIREIMENALSELFEKDNRIIFRKLHEEAINHRLSVYIEENIKENINYKYLDVDLEYNKNYDMEKEIIGTDGIKYRIRPDIIIHQRENNQNNKIAIECKKNYITQKDRIKLVALFDKNQYGYENCFGIVYKPEKDVFEFYNTDDSGIEKYIIEKRNVKL